MSVHEFIIVFVMSGDMADFMFVDVSTAIYALFCTILAAGM